MFHALSSVQIFLVRVCSSLLYGRTDARNKGKLDKLPYFLSAFSHPQTFFWEGGGFLPLLLPLFCLPREMKA